MNNETMSSVLYVTHRVPYPPDKGDRIRTCNILRYLSSRCRVYLACLSDEPVSNETRVELERLACRIAIVPNAGTVRWGRGLWSLAMGSSISEGVFTNRELVKVLRSWAGEVRFDAQMYSASSLARYCSIDQLKAVPCCFDMIDVDSEKWLEYSANAAFPRNLIYGLEGIRLRQTECRLARNVESVILVSKAECDLFRRFCHDGDVSPVPNGVDLDYFHPLPCPDGPTCAFVGALDYHPNVEAVKWFADEVWPEVIARVPAARFLVIGRRAVAEVQSLGARTGIEIVGEVPDVRIQVANASVMVAPLKIARGIQNKVLEGMALQRAVIASREALIGINCQIGEDVLEAGRPIEWVETLLRIWSDGRLRDEIGRRGRQFVESFHQWENCLAPLDKLLKLDKATEANP